MNKYWWVKIEQVNFRFETKFSNLEIKSTTDLVECHHAST